MTAQSFFLGKVEAVEAVESLCYKVPLEKPHVKKALQNASTASTASTFFGCFERERGAV
jgi:hypothetical protein